MLVLPSASVASDTVELRLSVWDHPRSKKPLVKAGHRLECGGLLEPPWRLARHVVATGGEDRQGAPHTHRPSASNSGRPRHARTAYLGTPHSRLNCTAAARLHSAQSCRTGAATVVFFEKQSEMRAKEAISTYCDMPDFRVIYCWLMEAIHKKSSLLDIFKKEGGWSSLI